MRDNEVSLSTGGRLVGYDKLAHAATRSRSTEPQRVMIVGGGASGTLLAIRLLGEPQTEVILIERSGRFGRGLAYSAENDAHVLNVPPMRLSAFEDRPEHFWNWLVATGRVAGEDRFVFVPRRWYGDYLEATLVTAARREPGRLVLVRDEVVSLHMAAGDFVARLASGGRVAASACVLATGHGGAIAREPHSGHSELPLLILGTGLSMIDRFLERATDGPVIAMSRHGLLPRRHAVAAAPRLSAGDIPFGAEVSVFLRWARHEVETRRDWRVLVDGLRPFAQGIWQSWSISQRARFLRHARSYWDVHRHRVPPQAYSRLQGALAAGDLTCLAAVPVVALPGAGLQTVTYRRRGGSKIEAIEVRDVIDCRGPVRDWTTRPGSLVHGLLRDGLARLERLGLGIDITPAAELIAKDGRIQEDLFAIGPLGRGTFFEIEAIPEIRAQCDRLATTLVERKRARGVA